MIPITIPIIPPVLNWLDTSFMVLSFVVVEGLEVGVNGTQFEFRLSEPRL